MMHFIHEMQQEKDEKKTRKGLVFEMQSSIRLNLFISGEQVKCLQKFLRVSCVDFIETINNISLRKSNSHSTRIPFYESI